MRERVKAFIQKHGDMFLAIAMLAAPMASHYCRAGWYQPKEPTGLSDFTETAKKKKRKQKQQRAKKEGNCL